MTPWIWTLALSGLAVSFASLSFAMFHYLNKRGQPKIKVIRKSLLLTSPILLAYVVGLLMLLSQPEELTIFYDEAQHALLVGTADYHCEWHRIGVRNEGRTTLKNVAVEITSITAAQEEQNDELQKFVGLKLGVSVNPREAYRHPDNPPESSVDLRPGKEKTFDFLRVCTIPGNHMILHSSFFPIHKNTRFERLAQQPRGVIPPGKYTVTLSAQGDDLNPEEQQFEFWSSSSKSVTFRLVENVF